MDEHVYPNEATYQEQHRSGRPLAAGADHRGAEAQGARGRAVEPVPAATRTRRRADQPRIRAAVPRSWAASQWSSEVFNCSAPDTGNMETIERYGTEAQQAASGSNRCSTGKIRSAFAMTEPDVASSDATNIQSRIERDGDSYVINGRKWWSSGAGDPRCKILIVMGKTDPDNTDRHRQQSMMLVPRDTPGVTIKRVLPVFGFDDAPHGHAEIDVRERARAGRNMLLGEGRGFEIAQGRLGPGRIHHCMRAIGLAERALEMMCKRAQSRVAVRQAARRAGRDARAHRRSAHHDRQARLLVLQRRLA